jgi:putative transposase
VVDEGGVLAEVARRLADSMDELIERQLARLRAHPPYAVVPDDDLRRACRRNVLRVIATLGRPDLLVEVEEDERASAQRRALQGIPSDAVVEAYRAVLSVLRDAFIEEAGALGADPAAVLAVTTRLWDLTDRYSDVLVSARQQVEIDAARRDELHRIAFLQRLLVGAVDPAELVEGGAVYGVLPGRQYWVFRGRGDGGEAGLRRLGRHLEQGSAYRRRVLIAPLDDDVAGIADAPPAPLDGAVIALAGPVELAGVAGAFTEATQVLTAATRYGRTGVVDKSSLSLRVAIEQQTELGELLYRRHVARLADCGPATAELLETLATWMRERRSVPAAARALAVHENTVRYRLARYAKLTGTDVGDTDVLVEAWWALEYASIRRGG